MAKKLDGIARKKVNAAMRQRHSQPQLAARNLLEVLGHVPKQAVVAHISRTNPAAVDELWALLPTSARQDRAS
jgi:hypothetical protein